MSFDVGRWVRLQYEGVPVWVQPERPEWFVPNEAGDALLQRLAAGEALERAQEDLFLQRLPDPPPRVYDGRAGHLATDRLEELWLHVTNRCNARCSHCLFCSGPDAGDELPAERALDLAGQAHRLGCRVFALTGGEPTVHPEFASLVDGLLTFDESRVVVLTNGLLLDRVGRWDPQRLHLQVSLDGLQPTHDAVRGAGSFERVTGQLAALRRRGATFTVSICVMRQNAAELPALVDLAAELGAGNVHLMWYFVRGRGDAAGWADPDALAPHVVAAAERAARHGLPLDNVEALRAQVFAPPGTVHDGTNAGWTSLAVGPEGALYPSPALVGVTEMAAPVNGDLATTWRQGAALERVRRATAAPSGHPLRFLLGGGDSDHSYIDRGELSGADPLLALHERLALWTIAREALRYGADGPPAVRLKMGDVLASCGPHGAVATTHGNCLLAVAGVDGHTAVREFYRAAAENPREDIRNPVFYPEELIAHIPEASRLRSYGCGSPVVDAAPRPGETVVDLGCGTGIECFIAARMVGPDGLVHGIDMLDAMLIFAERSAEAVAAELGYRNTEFHRGLLEALPLDDRSVDLVLSNCVLNLSPDKRRTFAEIHRVLRPGGRLVVADVVCETEPDPAIRNDEALRGQCIAGALTQRDLFGLLAESGFTGARVIRRAPYRVVGGHPFFSLTFAAHRPDRPLRRRVMYRGPAAALVTATGAVLPAGQVVETDADEAEMAGDALLVLDEQGAATNQPGQVSCGCASPAAEAPSCCGPSEPVSCCAPPTPSERHAVDCMVCGSRLEYGTAPAQASCEYCGRTERTAMRCERGHFVCDACHASDALEAIERICTATTETDMLALLRDVRRHPAIATHGPEHHALVPAIIVTAYRNRGGKLPHDALRLALDRGRQVPGGFCGYAGGCGAALGVGIGLSAILEATPLTPAPRQAVTRAVGTALGAIAEHEAARCCLRDCFIALREAARLSRGLLPIPLRAEAELVCEQIRHNRECLGRTCPLWPVRG
jgi:MoaA/NifB/PqqE/SkfB family radical SAM enzyme/SAM-dependent methyltransferase